MTTKPAEISTSDAELTRRARRAFFVGLLDLTAKMSGAMLAPLFLGLFIDSRISGGGQAYAITGFLVGMVCGVLVLRGMMRGVSRNGGIG